MAWLAGYTYRKKITITGQAGATTNWQVKLKVGESSGATGEDFDIENHDENWPNDIRFTDNDETTLLDFWRESDTGAASNRLQTVYVEVADDCSSNVDIYCYYGKVADTDASNGANTFVVFDDFESENDGDDPADWTVSEPANTDIHVEADQQKRGSKSLYTQDVSAIAGCFVERTFTAMVKLRMEVDVRPVIISTGGDTNDNLNIGAFWEDGITTLATLANIYGDGSVWGYFDGGHNKSATTWTANTWHKVTVELNCTADTFNFIIDDTTTIASGVAFNNVVDDVDSTQFPGSAAAHEGELFWDDYRISKWNGGTEPAFSSAAAETTEPPAPSGLPSKRLLLGVGI